MAVTRRLHELDEQAFTPTSRSRAKGPKARLTRACLSAASFMRRSARYIRFSVFPRLLPRTPPERDYLQGLLSSRVRESACCDCPSARPSPRAAMHPAALLPRNSRRLARSVTSSCAASRRHHHRVRIAALRGTLASSANACAPSAPPASCQDPAAAVLCSRGPPAGHLQVGDPPSPTSPHAQQSPVDRCAKRSNAPHLLAVRA